MHSPLQATPHWLGLQEPLEAFAKYGGQEDRWYQNAIQRRTYAAMVAEMDDAVGKVVDALDDSGLLANGVLFLSADNGGITGGAGIGGGFNYPFRGQKATLWEGGCRANGFVHSPLLKTTGYEYRGLVHVSDWFPTLLTLAGGDLADHPGLDGHAVWEAITTNGPSPRTELLHNIDVFGGLGRTGFGNANIRVGDLKLIVGSPGSFWFD